ncbi:MAG: exonuclease domain-containing protein [Micropepsaceae bacterium]
MSFIFYDTETTGTDPTFDQLLQFAAVRTDDELNVTDTFNSRCRLLPWVVPSPGAMMVTGVTPSMLHDAPLSYFQMQGEIHNAMTSWSRGGAVFLGWNSLRFDENFLRQSFYQTMLPVYLTVTGGNGRGDVMRMAQFASICRAGALKLAMNENGKVTFRLGQFAQANGIVLENAHEAMADTMATLAVARLIRQRAPEIWHPMVANARKAQVQRLVEDNTILMLVDYYGASAFSSIVTPIGPNASDTAEYAFFDLQFAPRDILTQDEPTLAKTLAGTPKPIRTARLNAQPGLLPFALAPHDAQNGLLSLSDYERRSAEVKASKLFCTRVGKVLASRYGTDEKPEQVEQAMFDGFPTNADTARMRRFHAAEPARRAEIISEFSDQRWKEFAWRFVGAENPDALGKEEAARWRAWRNARVRANGVVPWRTVAAALEEVETMRASASAKELAVLARIEEFLNTL